MKFRYLVLSVVSSLFPHLIELSCKLTRGKTRDCCIDPFDSLTGSIGTKCCSYIIVSFWMSVDPVVFHMVQQTKWNFSYYFRWQPIFFFFSPEDMLEIHACRSLDHLCPYCDFFLSKSSGLRKNSKVLPAVSTCVFTGSHTR